MVCWISRMGRQCRSRLNRSNMQQNCSPFRHRRHVVWLDLDGGAFDTCYCHNHPGGKSNTSLTLDKAARMPAAITIISKTGLCSRGAPSPLFQTMVVPSHLGARAGQAVPEALAGVEEVVEPVIWQMVASTQPRDFHIAQRLPSPLQAATYRKHA